MEDLLKNIYVNELFDIYGNLLTLNQQKMIELYYQDDLSLSEIAEELEVSRNAVFDSLKKGIASLENYENILHINKKRHELDSYFASLKESEQDKEKLDLINEIESKVR